MSSSSFTQLPLSNELLAVLGELGFESMTPIQAQALPLLLDGKDIIGEAQTGSGKTLAFVLPILHGLSLEDKNVQALILCPTRELVTQVVGEIRKVGRRLAGLQVLAAIGGQSGREQSEAIERGTQILVGTPGRVADLLQRNRLSLEGVRTIILDEADKMLELGFAAELRTIMSFAPPKRQTALFSATFPEEIALLSRRYQKNPRHLRLEVEDVMIETFLYEGEEHDKVEYLLRVLQQHPSSSTIIFCNTKAAVEAIVETLKEKGVDVGGLHGDMDQKERERQMALLRNGSYRILVATDVAGRGLDIENLELVVNYDFPLKPETYVHRVGRVGRAGKKGEAVLLASPRDTLRVMELEKTSKLRFIRKPLGFKNQWGLDKSVRESAMKTISISGGRKDKLRPGDILGALTSEGGIAGAEVGKIELLDHISYVAVQSSVAEKALEHLRQSRIKGQKLQIRFVKK